MGEMLRGRCSLENLVFQQGHDNCMYKMLLAINIDI